LKRFLCGWAALCLFFVTAVQARPDFIYWSDATRGEIRRANLDGTEMTTLISGLISPYGPALDFAGGMFWAEPFIGDISRASIDGTGKTTLVRGLVLPFNPVVDPAGGQMYWPEQNAQYPQGAGLGDIKQANLDGTGRMTLVKGLNWPGSVALDIGGGKIYWSNGPPSFDLWRANLDGSNQEIVVPNAKAYGDIRLDVAEGKIYWCSNNFGFAVIGRANLDGSALEVLVHGKSPDAMALDIAGGKMYWADNSDIWRANLDGTGQEILITGLGAPSGIALDLGTPGTAAFYAIAAPDSVPSGTAFDLTITAADPYGSIDANYQGTVTFSTSDTDPGIVLPADYTFTADDHGVHTFPGAVSLVTPGDQTITVTDTASGISGSASITVVPPN
jgi:hypothetical protein